MKIKAEYDFLDIVLYLFALTWCIMRLDYYIPVIRASVDSEFLNTMHLICGIVYVVFIPIIIARIAAMFFWIIKH